MVNRIKKLSNVAFQSKTCFRIVSAHLTQHGSQSLHSFVVSFTDATGKRIVNIGRFKNWIQNLKNSMVNYSVSNSGFVNVPQFWIMDVETCIFAVSVNFITKVMIELKKILLQISLEAKNVWLFAFAFLKFVPSQKEIFRFNYLFE